jgi:hypothetical protein
VLVVLNTTDCAGGGSPASRTSDGSQQMQTSFAQGVVLSNVLQDQDPGDRFTVGPAGALDLTLPCRGAKILVPES